MGRSRLRAVLASETTERWGTTLLPISAGSMSMWMRCSTRGANESSRVVTRSSQRIPIMITTSASQTALLV